MRKLVAIVAVSAAVSFISARATACSMDSCPVNGIEMRASFVVKIKYAGKALSGVKVEVTRYRTGEDATTSFSGTTTSDGIVHVRLSPGDYWLHTDLLGVSAGSECFQVTEHPSGRAKRRVNYEWGNYSEPTQRIAGSLIDSQPGKGDNPLMNLVHRIETPITSAPMKLDNPLTGELFRTATDSEGRFSFETVPKGVYVLDVLDAHLLIKLDPTSNRNQLRLVSRPPGGGDCGGVGLF